MALFLISNVAKIIESDQSKEEVLFVEDLDPDDVPLVVATLNQCR